VGAEIFPVILSAPIEATTYEILKAFRDRSIDWPAGGDFILIDFDTPDDLARHANRFQR
jgi:CTP:molybdopterin cytidylyltransferase MocA